jgi:hypothetical protein
VFRPAFLALFAALPACARVMPLPPATPEVPRAAWEPPEAGAELGPGRHANTASPALAKTVMPPAGAAPDDGFAPPPATSASSPIPGGATCLSALQARHVPYHASGPVTGVATPVVLNGPLHGIRFYAADKRPFLADCRLVLALDSVAADLASLGVTEIRFSGAYVYKLTHPGRMSMHAYGLAADLHAFRIGGGLLEVKQDFARGRGTACTGGMPALNLVACRLRARGVFKEQLGPDDNAAHFDHFHVGLKPLPGEVQADLPMPGASHHPTHHTARH